MARTVKRRGGVGRAVGGVVRTATDMMSQVPGGESLVLQAVKDMFSELKRLRRENAQLQKRVDTLEQRLERRGGTPSPRAARTTAPAKRAGTRTKATARRAAPAATAKTSRKSPARRSRPAETMGRRVGKMLDRLAP
jgi:hypothetical protein